MTEKAPWTRVPGALVKNTERWKRLYPGLRDAFLDAHPFCCKCGLWIVWRYRDDEPLCLPQHRPGRAQDCR